MICARCDKRMPRGVGQPINHDSPSGAGITVYVHPYLCRPAQAQTSPAPAGRVIREV